MDVIAMHQAGFVGAVATLGTALTAEHATLLSRLGVGGLSLMFDHDQAGLKATLSGLDQVIGSRFRVRATNVPNGKDPADAVMSGPDGVEAVRRALAAGVDEAQFRVKAAIEKHGKDTRDGKRQVLMELLPRLQQGDILDEGSARIRDVVCDELDIEPAVLLDWLRSKAKRKTLTDTHMVAMTAGRGEEGHELALLRQILVESDACSPSSTD